MFEDQTYDVNCPFCGVKNTLKRDDLGVMLNCGACGEQFKFDEPLKQEKAKRKVAEAKRREAARKKREAEREAEREEMARRAAEQRERDRQVADARARRQSEVAATTNTLTAWRADRYPFAMLYEKYVHALAVFLFIVAAVILLVGLYTQHSSSPHTPPVPLIAVTPIYGMAIGVAIGGFLTLVSRDVLRAFLDSACALCEQTSDGH